MKSIVPKGFTPVYSAPEMQNKEDTADKTANFSSDIFSVACVFYNVLTDK